MMIPTYNSFVTNAIEQRPRAILATHIALLSELMAGQFLSRKGRGGKKVKNR